MPSSLTSNPPGAWVTSARRSGQVTVAGNFQVSQAGKVYGPGDKLRWCIVEYTRTGRPRAANTRS